MPQRLTDVICFFFVGTDFINVVLPLSRNFSRCMAYSSKCVAHLLMIVHLFFFRFVSKEIYIIYLKFEINCGAKGQQKYIFFCRNRTFIQLTCHFYQTTKRRRCYSYPDPNPIGYIPHKYEEKITKNFRTPSIVGGFSAIVQPWRWCLRRKLLPNVQMVIREMYIWSIFE